ncbi:unnamed protein product [Nezara viridula]|uniref:Uncharacterized protein n=1 Tax=Nezara viridula TaxID=85310 RepID=A0A9P0HN60_NEZVI|nr:unnamed protein product [Nezara viridula]
MNVTPVNLDRAYREIYRAEERTACRWRHNWSWIIDEYRTIYNELKALKKDKIDGYQSDEEEEDDRTIKPLPETSGHEYGHIATKPEFALEKFSSQGLTTIPKSLSQGELYKALDKKFTIRFGSTQGHGFLNYYRKTISKPQDRFNHFGLTLL